MDGLFNFKLSIGLCFFIFCPGYLGIVFAIFRMWLHRLPQARSRKGKPFLFILLSRLGGSHKRLLSFD
jgi:hypothetical protein